MDCSSLRTGRNPRRPARGRCSSTEQEATIFHAAGRRVTAAVRRQPAESTRRLLGEAADTPVYGAFVSLKRAGRLRSCCGHIESTVPLWKALDWAADRAATDDPRFPPITPAELNQLDMDVWILWGPEPVTRPGRGSRASGRHRQARGADCPRPRPRTAAAGRGRGPWASTPGRSWNRSASRPACRPTPGRTTTRSCGCSRATRFDGRLEPDWPRRPSARRGRRLLSGRCPRSAADASTSSLPRRPRRPAPEPWPGAMVPHAGWIYSGRLAAAVFRRVAIPRQRDHPLSQSTARTAAAWAVAPHRRWLFPGGELAVGPGTGRGGWPRRCRGWSSMRPPIARNTPSRCSCRLLARVAPQVRVVGITVGDGSLPELLRFGVAMAVVLRDMPRAPAADHFQRHEPLCRRRRRRAGWIAWPWTPSPRSTRSAYTTPYGGTASACAAWAPA